MFDRTAEMMAYEVMMNVSRVETFGIGFGSSTRDLARKASKTIAQRIGWLCRRR